MLLIFDVEDFSCKKIGYKSVVANVERRWHQSFSIENKIFVHGGWNDGGPLSDTIYFDLGNDCFFFLPFFVQTYLVLIFNY